MKFNDLIPEICISNYDASINFYTKILEFKVDYQRKEEGFAFLSLGKAQIMIDQVDKGRTWRTGHFEYPLGRGINFQIKVKNVGSLSKKLKKKKIKLFLETEEKWYRKGKCRLVKSNS